MLTPDDNQADDLLQGLVERYSPSTQERPAVEYLVGRMAALGFRAYIDGAGNAVGEIGDGERAVLLLGHIDTVPGFINVRREGGRLYGRGAVDAKGPLATFVMAAARAGVTNGKRIIVAGAVEEEAATSKGARFLLDKLTPEAVIIGEPSGWDCVTTGYKGRLLVQYILTREIGHTAGPETNACEDAFAFWRAVTEYAAACNAARPRVFEQLTPSLRAMHSEDDGFLQTATLTLGFRLPPNIDTDALETTLCTLAGDATLGFSGREVAYHAAKNTPLARAFVKAIDAEGGRIQFKVKSGTSDMNVVGPVWNCPILAYGPGDSALDHTPHESIELNEYHKGIAVLTRVLKDVGN
ncbi:MAG TPA: [LysW]-lysine hydrolase [Anaerolineae bacterium]|nr:[LysW]-lysine hydrolase [Anaerolineae bacterium]HQI86672.1 [LysW]-lysine hydrolase [Anaerolineae bacterium]HQK13438.1 [LysW]-lysine hydrolase [Anaerolineae bacterium]